MIRSTILLVVLALGVAACGSDQTSETDASDATPSATTAPTEEPTAEATEEPAASADAGDGTPLADLIPDEVDGVAGTSNPAMESFMAQILGRQGVEAENFEFEFVTYGTDANAVVLTAFRIPGVNQAQMETLARMMSGAEGAEGVEAETVDIGGKSVLRMTAAAGASGAEGVVFIYFVEGAAFSIVSPSSDTALAESLLAELP